MNILASTTVSAVDFNDALKSVVESIVWKNHYVAAQNEDSSYYFEIDKYIAASKYLKTRFSTSYINSILTEHENDSDKEWDDFCNSAFSTREDGSEVKKRFTIMHEYVEHNNYYRKLFGLPDYDANRSYYIFPSGYYNTNRDVMQNCRFEIDVDEADIILTGEEYGEGSNPNQAMWEFNVNRENFPSEEAYQEEYKKYLDKYIYVQLTNSLFKITDPSTMSRRNSDNVDSFDNPVPDGVTEIIPNRVPLHEWDHQEKALFIASDTFASIVASHSDDKGFEYLKYMGEKKIWPYDARVAERYQLLYVAPSEPSVLSDTFKQMYENCRMYVLRVFYTEAFGTNQTGLYEGFIGMSILFMAINQMYYKYLDADIDRDFFDLESLRVVYEAYSVPFYNNIPITYHKRIVKKINKLIKYKGSAQVFYDLCEIFDYDILGIYQYYLVKERQYNVNGVPVTSYTTATDEAGHPQYDAYGNPVLTYNYDKMYDFYFLKCNINEDPFPQLLDDNNKIDYELVAVPDKYWFDKDPDTIKTLTEQEYNYIETKYIGVQVMFSITEMLYESCYFMHMLLDNKEITSQYLTINNARHNMTVNLFDFIVYIFAMICRKNGFEGTIPSDPADVARIYGWNFKGLFKKLQEKSLQGFCIEKDFNDTSTLDEIDPRTKKLIIEELGNSGYGIVATRDGIVTGITANTLHVQYYATEELPMEDVEYPLSNSVTSYVTNLNPGVGFKAGDLLAYSNESHLIWHGKVIQAADLDNWMTVNKFLQKSDEGKEAYAKVVELIKATNFDTVRTYQEINEVYQAMKDCMAIIEDRMISTHDRDEFNAWSHLRRIVETTERLNESFALEDGTTAPTYEDLLRERAPDLWILLQNFSDFELGAELDYCLAQLKLLCEDLKYIEYIDSIDMTVVTDYLYKLLRFFKSAKVDLMEFNLIFKIDSRTENLIKFLDLIYASERKVWIEDEFARWLSTDGIYSTHIERTIKDLAYPFDFSDKIVCGGQERYFYDAFHGLPRSGQPYCFTTSEWENIQNDPNMSQWIPFLNEWEGLSSNSDTSNSKYVSKESTHDSIGDTLYYYIDKKWLTFDDTAMEFYEKTFKRNEGESDEEYSARVNEKITQNNDFITNHNITKVNETNDYYIYEMRMDAFVEEFDGIQNATEDSPVEYTPEKKIRLDLIAFRNSSTDENYNLTLHIVECGIEKAKCNIRPGNSVVSINYHIPGNAKVSFYVTGANGEVIDMLLKFSYVWTSAFRTEVKGHITKYADDDMSYLLSNDYISESFRTIKGPRDNLFLRDRLIRIV